MPIISHARLRPCLVARMVVSGICAMVRAISSTVSSSSARGTTLLTMPHSSACAALIVGARNRYSAARL